MGRAAVATEREREVREDLGDEDPPWRVVLFNCDCHTFDEVEKIVMKAIRCTLSRARQISFEVHHKGAATIFEGHRERAEAVADVVASIGLKVKVCQ